MARPREVSLAEQVVQVGDVELAVVSGGNGPPVLLLHGFPQTHLLGR